MISQEEINNQLNNEYDKFLNGKYDGKVPIPENIVELFEIGVRILPPFAHKLNFHKVKAILTTDFEDLTIGNINDIIKVVLNISFERLYAHELLAYDMIHAVDKQIKFDKFVMAYNKIVEDFKKRLEVKKKTLEDLSGRNNGNMNGMKIVSS